LMHQTWDRWRCLKWSHKHCFLCNLLPKLPNRTKSA
jgi:hypothetical protein